MKLAIIIVNYKNNDLTRSFVREELARISIPYDVVIVDNGGDETSCANLSNGMGPNVHVLTNPVNSGFAIGNNKGARFAIETLDADTLLFANNDIKFLDDDVVERLSDKLWKMPEVGIIGPKIIGTDGRCQSPEPYISFWDRHIWMYLSTPFLSREKKIERFGLDYSQTAQEGFHYKLMGAFFLARSRDFLECGMMDEGTFLYSEEPILTERMAGLGLKPYYYPEVSVLHDHGATTLSVFRKRQLNAIQFESESFYYRKYKHTSGALIFLGKVVNLLVTRIK